MAKRDMSRLDMAKRVVLAALLVACLCVAGCARGGGVDHSGPFAPVHTVQVNGAELGYCELGSGAPLLLIMGYAGTMDVWDHALVGQLARQRRVILFDNRGVGTSRAPDGPLSIELMAADTGALLDALGIAEADVLGWSMGSVIAQELALARPDKVGKLVLYGSVHEKEPVEAALARFAAMTPEQFMAALLPEAWLREHPDVYSRLPVPAVPADPAVVARQGEALVAWGGSAQRLAGLQKDVLLLVGAEDTVTPPEQSLAMAGMIDGAWLVRFKGGGHWLMYQAPEDMARIILDFLDTRQDLLR